MFPAGAADFFARYAEAATYGDTATLQKAPGYSTVSAVACRVDALPARQTSDEAHDVPATVQIAVALAVAVAERDRFVVRGTTYQVQTVSTDETFAVERICDCAEVWT